jgi:gamma-glutamylcyclotransferase (GGCT)/AIG2-like uncharacterized protein YtfP
VAVGFAIVFSPANALAAYGTLRPGEINHHVVKDMTGQWIEGYIKGYVFDVSWGGADGYPGFHPDRDGHRIPVGVLVCDDWDRHWDRLDRFEGPGYRRSVIQVFHQDSHEPIGQAQVYECLTDND